MTRRLRNRGQKGFTLIELLIVVAIIGIIAAMLIPNLLDALQKGKQKRTVADARNIGTAWMSWLTDQVQASAAGGQNNPDWPFGISNDNYAHALLQADLDGSLPLPSMDPAPEYTKRVPEMDGWGWPYTFALNEVNLLARNVMAIRSEGKDGKEGNGITWCNDEPAQQGLSVHGFFDSRRYDCDIIWKDGFFVQAPAGLDSLGPQP